MQHFYIIARQFIMTMATILLVFAVAATLSDALPYLFSSEVYDSFFGDRDPDRKRFVQAYLHIAPAIAALMIGPFQLSDPCGITFPGYTGSLAGFMF